MTMGEYIKKLRTEKGLSQEELGKLCGVNRAAVNKWEKGTVANMKRSTIEKLSSIFGVSPTELMCFDDQPEEKQATDFYAEYKIDEEAFEKILHLVKLYSRELKKLESLDDIDKGKIFGRIETMLEADKYHTERKDEE